MGSGYKSFSTASVLTAADLNNYCQSQSVMYFASTTARDAEITSPQDGMTAYIGSNNASEGLYTYNGTSWHKGPGWNAPWGYVTHSSKTSQTSLSTSTVDVTSVTFTAVANRYYLVRFYSPYLNTVAAAACDVYLTDASNVQKQVANFSARGAGFYEPVELVLIETISAGSVTRKIRSVLSTSTGTLQGATDGPAQLIVMDIGPSGAPV